MNTQEQELTFELLLTAYNKCRKKAILKKHNSPKLDNHEVALFANCVTKMYFLPSTRPPPE